MPEWRIRETVVSVVEGDLTEQAVDAIVNAANNDLQLGAGVAGAIARKGGPEIQRECDRHGPIKVGEAALTGAGDLKARHVIHAASMHLGGSASKDSLGAAMDQVFRLSREHQLRSLAVPAVGAGIAGLPMRDCAEVMAECVSKAAAEEGAPREVRFVLFGEPAVQEFESAFGRRFR